MDAKYGIPKSTLHLYSIGKIELGSRPGPSSILTTAEEEKLVQHVVEMSCIGYGCTKQQVQDMVQAIISKRMVIPILLLTIGQVKNGGSYLTSNIQYVP